MVDIALLRVVSNTRFCTARLHELCVQMRKIWFSKAYQKLLPERLSRKLNVGTTRQGAFTESISPMLQSSCLHLIVGHIYTRPRCHPGMHFIRRLNDSCKQLEGHPHHPSWEGLPRLQAGPRAHPSVNSVTSLEQRIAVRQVANSACCAACSGLHHEVHYSVLVPGHCVHFVEGVPDVCSSL
jgi:hypothetical protein